jgi:2-methylisocitrate lyase-like PEP mutase family enzyme
MVETGRTPLLTPSELAELGFVFVVSPLTALLTVARAVRESLRVLRDEGSLRDHLHLLSSFDEFTDLVGLAAIRAIEERYPTDK